MSKWPMVRLGDIATYINGYPFKPDDWGNEGLPIIRIQNLTDPINSQYNFYNKMLSDRYLIKKGDVLISWSATLGAFDWKLDDALLNQHIFKVVFNKIQIDKKYFILCVNQSIEEMQKHIHGSTMKHIVKSAFDNILIPLPPLDEQRRIAAVLDKAQSLIDLRKKQIAEMDVLVKSKFIEMFGTEYELERWDCKQIEEVADVNVGVVIKPSQYYTDEIHGVKAFRSLNIGEMFIKDNDWVYFTPEGHRTNSKSELKTGDLLIVRSGYPGTSCVVTSEYAGCNAIDVIIARPRVDMVNPFYMCAFTNFAHGMNQIKAKIGGAAQQHFNVGAYNNLIIAIPPIHYQKAFEDFVQQNNKLKQAQQNGLALLEQNYNALMQQYFS